VAREVRKTRTGRALSGSAAVMLCNLDSKNALPCDADLPGARRTSAETGCASLDCAPIGTQKSRGFLKNPAKPSCATPTTRNGAPRTEIVRPTMLESALNRVRQAA